MEADFVPMRCPIVVRIPLDCPRQSPFVLLEWQTVATHATDLPKQRIVFALAFAFFSVFPVVLKFDAGEPVSCVEFAAMSKKVFVGTMGWAYSDWNGVFYPEGMAAKEAISQYATVFETVEIDSTFYGTPRESTVLQWRDAVPDGFTFCPKVPRLITHEMGLRDCEEQLREFVDVIAKLGDKRGVMLLQMPPSFTRENLLDLERFLPILEAVRDETAKFAIEFRHASLIGDDVNGLLTRHSVALASTDYSRTQARYEETAEFVYVRLIGHHGAYEQHKALQGDHSGRIKRWTDKLKVSAEAGSEAWVLCNDDYEGYAPATANRVKAMLGQETIDKPKTEQLNLFE